MVKDPAFVQDSVSSHGVFCFENEGVVFRSDFDSGNLAKVERTKGTVIFTCYTAADCMGSICESSARTWFYFHVKSRMPTITLTITNLNSQGKLFREGMKPVVKTPNSSWQRIEGPVSYYSTGTSFEISFIYTFTENEAYFAFTYPWSYSQYISLNTQLEKQLKNSHLYFHREVLALSLEKRRCELLTISSYKGITEKRDKRMLGLFPQKTKRARMFVNKEIAFLSARVHPGETPGSHVMNGFLRFITSEDPKAKELREKFVFKVVPMLNPDGVYRGHYRTDTQGLNLNRFYHCPSLANHPTIYAIKQIFTYYHQISRVYCYVDLHAHATKRACFMYGNYMRFSDQIEGCTLAKLLSLNSPYFDYIGSEFTERNMNMKDKNGNTKEGSGRVALYKISKIPRCYTLECNYNSGFQMDFFTTEIFESIGTGLGAAILDTTVDDINLRKIKFEVASHIAKTVPFRFDGSLKQIVKNFESFEAYYNRRFNKNSNEKEKELIKSHKSISFASFDSQKKIVGLSTKKMALLPVKTIMFDQSNLSKLKSLKDKQTHLSLAKLRIRTRSSQELNKPCAFPLIQLSSVSYN